MPTIGIVVAFLQFYEREGVRAIAVDFIRTGETEGRLPAEISGGHEQIHGANGIDIKVVIGDRGGFVVRRLGGGVDDEIRSLVSEQIAYAWSVTNVQGVMTITGKRADELLNHRTSRALMPKKLRTHIIVNAHDIPAFAAEYANTR
jgi:hypothetical protein